MIDYLLCPSLRKNDGSGHLRRMIRLQKELDNSMIYIDPLARDEALSRYAELDSTTVTGSIEDPGCIILDFPWISRSDLLALMKRAPVLAVDLGGDVRRLPAVLIDTLPYPGNRLHREYFSQSVEDNRSGSIAAALGIPTRTANENHRANILDPGLLELPQIRKTPDIALNRVLVSFGGSDPSGLTEAFIHALISRSGSPDRAGAAAPGNIDYLTAGAAEQAGSFPGLRGDIVRGPGLDGELPDLPGGWNLIPGIPDIQDRYTDYDLVITSYGLTAWEAQYAGVKTAVIDASFYHQELARLSGFFSLPPDHISTLLDSFGDQAGAAEILDRLARQASAVQKVPSRSLGERIKALTLPELQRCPVCGSPAGHSAAGTSAGDAPASAHPAIVRDAGRSYFRCGECDSIYLIPLKPQSIDYSREYFFDDYKKQYGKTYLEDFEHIRAMGNFRIREMRKQLLTGSDTPRVLDIGCAFGPFLKAAADAGWEVEGTDISAEAVDYIQNELGFTSRAGSIRNAGFRDGFESAAYDAVSMWYVIEHFPDLHDILPWIRRILKPWGVFAMATPSYEGISGSTDLEKFLLSGPEDHYSVWSPRQADKAGAVHGFQLQSWNSTGHHGERFPGFLGSPVLRPVSNLFSRILRLGDGFEAFFIRLGDDGDQPAGS